MAPASRAFSLPAASADPRPTVLHDSELTVAGWLCGKPPAPCCDVVTLPVIAASWPLFFPVPYRGEGEGVKSPKLLARWRGGGKTHHPDRGLSRCSVPALRMHANSSAKAFLTLSRRECPILGLSAISSPPTLYCAQGSTYWPPPSPPAFTQAWNCLENGETHPTPARVPSSAPIPQASPSTEIHALSPAPEDGAGAL